MRVSLWFLGLFLMVAMAFPAFAQDAAASGSVMDSVFVQKAHDVLEAFVHSVGSLIFYEIYGLPFIVLWLLVAGLYFTVSLGFLNFRLFPHAINVVRGKYTHKDAPGEVSHFQALTAAVSATVGLGNIAGVALAVSMGGPGAVIWMVIFGFLGMSTKCVEVMMGQKYRHIDENGKVSGGAFHYLREGLKDKGLPKFGAFLAGLFAVFCVLSSFGGSNMFQANQAVSILTSTFDSLSELDWVIALVMAVAIAVILMGGIKRIATIAEKVVPLMAAVYMIAAITVIFYHVELIPDAVVKMFSLAFSFDSAFGGILGAIIAGARRSAFSNEAGMGSAPIAHAAAKSDNPVQEGCVALLEPFIDTVIICFITGLMITVTGVYEGSNIDDGVLLTGAAFETVAPWFSVVLSVAVVMFAFSTMMSWSYYGERAWTYLFGQNERVLHLYYVLFATATFVGGVTQLGLVLEVSDIALLSMSLPNILGLYIMRKEIHEEFSTYIRKLRSGEMKMVN